jgi:hypothetical protein
MYDPITRLRKEDIWTSYQDWTESTDYIPRRVGGITLRTWFEFIGFPKWYRNLVLFISQFSYRIKEIIYIRDLDDPGIRREQWFSAV